MTAQTRSIVGREQAQAEHPEQAAESRPRRGRLRRRAGSAGNISPPLLSCSVVSHAVHAPGMQPARPLGPRDSPAGALERVARPSSRGPSPPLPGMEPACVSDVSCPGRQVLHMHHLGEQAQLLKELSRARFGKFLLNHVSFPQEQSRVSPEAELPPPESACAREMWPWAVRGETEALVTP